MDDYLVLSFGNLKHRGLRSWLTILGIFIGIAAVVSLISLGSGLKTAVVGQLGVLSADILSIQNAGTGMGPPGSDVVEKLTEHDFEIVKDVPGVEIAVKRYIRVATVKYDEEVKYNYLISLPDDNIEVEFTYEALNMKIEEGRLLRESDRGKIIIGSDIKAQFEKDISSGDKILINNKEFEVIGIAKPLNSFIMNQMITMPEEDLVELLEIGDEIDIIAARVENADQIQEIAERIKEKMRGDRNLELGEEDFSVDTPLESAEALTTVLNIVNLIIIGIAAISLLVGGIGIMNTMYTSVLERKKEIGIMKAIGAKNKDILSIFLIESGLLGLAGGIIGALIGLGFALFAAFAANSALGTTILTVQPSYPLLLSAILFSFIVGIVSGVWPALQASKLNAVDAIRGN